MQFRGREIAHVDLGKKLLLRFAEDLKEIGSVEGHPKLEGRNAHIIMSPIKVQLPAAVKPAKEKMPDKAPVAAPQV